MNYMHWYELIKGYGYDAYIIYVNGYITVYRKSELEPFAFIRPLQEGGQFMWFYDRGSVRIS